MLYSLFVFVFYVLVYWSIQLHSYKSVY